MLEDEQVLLLNILKESLKGETFELVFPGNDSFSRLLKLAAVHQVLPLVCEAIYQSDSLQKNAAFSSYKQQAISDAGTQIIRTDEFLGLYRKIQKQGIHPIITKGVICQSLYPRPLLRTSVDDDLFVPGKDFVTCHRLLLESGLRPDRPVRDPAKADEISYRKENSLLYIELHRNLFQTESDAYGDFNSCFRNAAEHSVHMKIQDITITTLNPTDHLLFLILHAFKHFLHSGIGIRPICDIGMFADHYHEEIDWDYIRDCLIRVKAYDYTRALFRIISQYLLPNGAYMYDMAAWNIDLIDEEPLLKDILESGTLGASSLSRLHSSNMTLNAVTEGKKKHNILHSVFLPLQNMKGRYQYLKKAPFLLPVAWGQRVISYLKETKNTSADDIRESIQIGRKRIALLEHYNVIAERKRSKKK